MKANLLNLLFCFNIIFCFTSSNLSFSQAFISEASFEDNSLPDGTGDGRDSWRVPDNNAWSPFGFGTTSVQISSNTANGSFPDGIQTARLPESGDRVAYQVIEVSPNTHYALTYYSEFEMDTVGDLTVSILKPSTVSYNEAQLEENIIAIRKDINNASIEDIFIKRIITFNSGVHESIIIFATNTGVSVRLDNFKILTNPSELTVTSTAVNGSITFDPEPINNTYNFGTEVTITATPNQGYQFDSWWYNFNTETTNPLTFQICDNIDIEAYFSKTQHTLTTEAVNGTITLSPEPINGTYEYGTEVTLTAIPNENYTFEGWWFNYEETSDSLTITIEKDNTVAAIFPKIDENFIPNPIILEPSFEDNSLPDGSGDGRDSWRAPNNTDWSPIGEGATVIQIKQSNNLETFPDGLQAAQLPHEERIAYQKIDVTNNTEHIVTFYSGFDFFGLNSELEGVTEFKISILKPNTTNYNESLLEENIIASKSFNSIGRLNEIFEKHFIQFDSKEFESIIIFITRSPNDPDSYFDIKLDEFEIFVNSTANSQTLSVLENENISAEFSISPNPTADFIDISTNNLDAIQQITIVNMLGEEIFKTKETKINVSDLENGLYLLKIEDNNNNVAVKKFVKQ